MRTDAERITQDYIRVCKERDALAAEVELLKEWSADMIDGGIHDLDALKAQLAVAVDALVKLSEHIDIGDLARDALARIRGES